MNFSSNCTNLVKQCEGCVLKSYQDAKGIWTIGWGHTSGVHAGMVITQAQADAWLTAELTKFAGQVSSLVKVTLNQNQFDALTSFQYNTGALAKSDLLKYLNAKNFTAAANEFPKWNHVGTRVLAGLTKRRALEKALFLKPVLSKPVQAQAKPTTHKVVSGDTLSEIAAANHTTVAALAKLNHLNDKDLITIGQVLKLK